MADDTQNVAMRSWCSRAAATAARAARPAITAAEQRAARRSSTRRLRLQLHRMRLGSTARMRLGSTAVSKNAKLNVVQGWGGGEIEPLRRLLGLGRQQKPVAHGEEDLSAFVKLVDDRLRPSNRRLQDCRLRSGVASGVSLRATMAALLRALLASSAAAPAPTSPRPAAAPSLESAQSLLITEQGNGWFRSSRQLSSESRECISGSATSQAGFVEKSSQLAKLLRLPLPAPLPALLAYEGVIRASSTSNSSKRCATPLEPRARSRLCLSLCRRPSVGSVLRALTPSRCSVATAAMPVKYHGAKGIGVHGGGDGEEAHHHITGVGYG
eukprot:COSAG04_NODE_849_length_9880_cov_57.811165_13_plen_325_part_01